MDLLIAILHFIGGSQTIQPLVLYFLDIAIVTTFVIFCIDLRNDS